MGGVDKNSELLGEYSKYMFPVLPFKRAVIARGEGAYVWDANGRKLLDLNSGQFCAVLGHSHPGIQEELASIAGTIQNTDTSTLSIDVLHAAKKIHDICHGMDGRVIFLSTGAEANECCLKYAKHIKEKPGVVSFDQGYHGLTHGTAGYSMSRSRIRPTLDHSYFVSCPRSYYEGELSASAVDDCVREFEDVIATNIEHIAVAIFEPIVSGGGMYFPPKEYFRQIREICTKYGVLLVFDECQTGLGRTGSWFHYQDLDCIPDFLVGAKAMGLGFPVSCVVANGRTISHEAFEMMHFSSHQNEPFSARLVSYAIDTIAEAGMLESNAVRGRYLLGELERLARMHPMISSPRGKGLMCAFNLEIEGVTNYKEAGEAFCRLALDYGILIQHCSNGRTIRLLPNYVIEDRDIDLLCSTLHTMISEHYEREG